MGKLLGALMLVLALEFAFMLFPAPEVANTALYDFILNPAQWSGNAWYGWLFTGVAILGAGAIIIGSFFYKADWVWRAGLVAASFITFGAVIFQFFIFLNAHLTYIGVTSARTLIVAILTAPLLLYFLMVSLDFISGKD